MEENEEDERGGREGLGERKWGNDAGVGGKRKRVG